MKKPVMYKIVGLLITIFLLFAALINNLIYNESSNILSFVVIHFLGYLFFLLIPTEMLFFFYLTEGFNPYLLFFLAIITAIFAQINDYIIGYLSSSNFENLISKRRYLRIKKALEKHQGIIIFIFNITVLSSPIIILVAGIMKLDFKMVFRYSFLGLALKYSLIILIYTLFYM